MAIPAFPYTFKDEANEVGYGKQVMENLEVLKAVLDPFYGGTGAGWSALTARAKATAFTASATRPAFVFVQVNVVPPKFEGATAVTVTTAGVVAAEYEWREEEAAWSEAIGPLPLAPNQTWSWDGTHITEVKSSYFIL